MWKSQGGYCFKFDVAGKIKRVGRLEYESNKWTGPLLGHVVFYVRDKRTRVNVVGVHRDDIDAYYTIEFPGGQQRQTVYSYLTPAWAGDSQSPTKISSSRPVQRLARMP
jgi:hypothetical protein